MLKYYIRLTKEKHRNEKKKKMRDARGVSIFTARRLVGLHVIPLNVLRDRKERTRFT